MNTHTAWDPFLSWDSCDSAFTNRQMGYWRNYLNSPSVGLRLRHPFSIQKERFAVEEVFGKSGLLHLLLPLRGGEPRFPCCFPSSFASMPFPSALIVSVWSRSARGVQTGLRMLKVRAQPFPHLWPKANTKDFGSILLESYCTPGILCCEGGIGTHG